MSSYFFSQLEKNTKNADFLGKLQSHAEQNKQIIYVLDKPLGDTKYNYNYSEGLIILSPKYKIAIINSGSNMQEFRDYVEDVIEDIGSISDKHLYKEIIGRPRTWKNHLIETELTIGNLLDCDTFFQSLVLDSDVYKKQVELIISLFIGSINDIDRVKKEVPENLLDKVKQKIQLFDGDQTRFIYQKPTKKEIRIQGMSGTGKTELLLHKLKDLYITSTNSKIFLTCHNKILADSLKKRIPQFFNFMKVEQQIEWDKRLWCTNAWGSNSNPNSGAYKFICAFYQLTFYSYSSVTPFEKVCDLAIAELKVKYPNGVDNFAFDYMLIDESQDFDESFFALCDLVTKTSIYIAGDIFQSIFDTQISGSIEPDYLLSKCYRTDPKTLMFAHALGMGLFEERKIRWLEQKEWIDCGYQFKRDDSNMIRLSREPIRRFEDVNEDYRSIELVNIKLNFVENIIKVINELRSDNASITPEDIGIILLDNSNYIYELADQIEFNIKRYFSWDVNKAYETKEKRKNSVFISNRNNVKGLEFPFVICVTKRIFPSLSYRNAIYTMLTRSFLKSYLLIQYFEGSGTTEIKNGLETILETKEMIIEEPSEEEKKQIATRFKYEKQLLSHYDLMQKVFKSLRIDKKYHEKLLNIAKEMDLTDSDEETLIQFVNDNMKYSK